MKSTSGSADGIDIDELERALKLELEDVQLVGQIDLDTWGVMAEEALRTRVHRCTPEKIRRLWPATLATYLVYQGLHAYEDSTFWRLVSIEELRDGKSVGPEFEGALGALRLSSFDDLEALEGFSKHTRGRYVRRIHLHGGIPRDSVSRVMQLLDSTLQSGASTAAEVVDLWYGLDLADYLHNKAAERCLLHAREFAVSLIGHLVELIRLANRGALDAVEGVPSHLVAGVEEYIASDRTAARWNFVEGPRIGIDPHHGEPYLLVPEDYDVVWSINGDEVGVSSRRVRQRFDLPLPDGEIWTIESDDGEQSAARHFSVEPLPGDRAGLRRTRSASPAGSAAGGNQGLCGRWSVDGRAGRRRPTEPQGCLGWLRAVRRRPAKRRGAHAERRRIFDSHRCSQHARRSDRARGGRRSHRRRPAGALRQGDHGVRRRATRA